MNQQERVKLTNELYNEYRKFAVRKRYTGFKKGLRHKEGYAWSSTALGRWCFLPVQSKFSLETVIAVSPSNLEHL
jgi:hypothetical protein